MTGRRPGPTSPTPERGQWVSAYAVHAYTSSGILAAFLVAAELVVAVPNVRFAFVLLAIAVLIDATDGPLARRWRVSEWAPEIDGRKIDDIIDYLTYTFLPLLLVWRMGWLPDPAILWIAPPLITSLFGFANVGAKDEARGFFLGFPSYWNVVAFYAGVWYHLFGPWVNAGMLLGFAILTVVPMGFVYPNLAPRPWRVALSVAGAGWLALALYMLREYPTPPAWAVWVSLAFPALYLGVSVRLWTRRRLHGAPAGPPG
jgi:phosphatidylcholine synthase